MGVTTLEATPIANGAAQEIIGPAGLYAAQDRPQDLAGILGRAMTIDPVVPFRRMMERYTIDHMIETYEASYAAAIAGAARRDVPEVTFPPIELTLDAPVRLALHA